MPSRIPEPKDPPRPHVLSLRLSDSEKEKLERACVLYAEHWKREKIGQAETMRAALDLFVDELAKAKAAR